MQGGDSYSVDQAARILQLTPGRIRQMLRAGELEGVPPEESGGTEPQNFSADSRILVQNHYIIGIKMRLGGGGLGH